MLSDEALYNCARCMENTAQDMARSADRMEAAAHRIALLIEDGYGGNGLKLIELLEDMKTNPVETRGQQ